MEMGVNRCEWCLGHDIYVKYHDEEWGVPVYDDRKLFEMLILEGAQAGLNWLTVLKKRENYRKAFDNFNAQKMAKYDEAKRQTLLADAGIIRNKLKVNAAIVNAQLFLEKQSKHGSFSNYIWQFVDGKPIVNNFKTISQVPATTPISDTMSKTLKKDGFKFVGSTILYAFMQAVGMVNDHTKTCFRHQQLQ